MAELHEAIGELRGELNERVGRVERHVAAIAELPAQIARAQAGALIQVLHGDGLKPAQPTDDDDAGGVKP